MECKEQQSQDARAGGGVCHPAHGILAVTGDVVGHEHPHLVSLLSDLLSGHPGASDRATALSEEGLTFPFS